MILSNNAMSMAAIASFELVGFDRVTGTGISTPSTMEARGRRAMMCTYAA